MCGAASFRGLHGADIRRSRNAETIGLCLQVWSQPCCCSGAAAGAGRLPRRPSWRWRCHHQSQTGTCLASRPGPPRPPSRCATVQAGFWSQQWTSRTQPSSTGPPTQSCLRRTPCRLRQKVTLLTVFLSARMCLSQGCPALGPCMQHGKLCRSTLLVPDLNLPAGTRQGGEAPDWLLMLGQAPDF